MKKYFIIFFFIIPLLGYSQKKKKAKIVQPEVITWDYVVSISVAYPDSAITGDCIKIIKDTMIVILYDNTPKHKANFVKLAQEGFFDGTTFHRVIPSFMIQGGDVYSKDNNPYNDGQGDPGYLIPAEFNPANKHKRGALAAARKGDQMNPNKESNGSQFYIVQAGSGATHLDGSYTVFGEVVKGLNVVDKIAKQPANPQNNRPVYDVKMIVKIEQMPKKRITELYGFQYQ